MISLKTEIRKEFIHIRNSLSYIRKANAEKKAVKIENLNFKKILSFASKPREINLWPLNNILVNQSRLYLPKTSDNNLEIYEITNISNQLAKGFFNILEPIPSKCRRIDPKELDLILVPALCFDKKNHRLGYGKGYYDAFLKPLECPAIGVGFIEQFYDDFLPVEPHDEKLDHLMLF
jgi:5-formyltetrahydrofolate cyclo-ligase